MEEEAKLHKSIQILIMKINKNKERDLGEWEQTFKFMMGLQL
jgi:hypothetical protein